VRLATAGVLDALHLRAAIEQTFGFRDTHAILAALPEPSAAWAAPYAAMAHEDRLAWPTIDEVTDAAQRFLDPILAGRLDASWTPTRWAWRATHRRPARGSPSPRQD